MKRIHTISLAVSILLLAFQATSWAQTITLDSISGTQFCAGDPISATFTVTGMWGSTNAFTLQLSNDSGTFDNGFQRLGALKDTAPGTFSIVTTIPLQSIYSSQYRVRVIGAYPYTESADNGSNILIGENPQHVSFKPGILESAVAVGVPIKFKMFDLSTSDDTEHVDYGADATQSDAGVTYNLPGLKTVFIKSVAPGGCSVMDSFQVNAFGCVNPVIPHDAIILSTVTVFTNNNESNKTFWLNPGVSLTLGDNESDTIFAEAGSSVSGQNGGQTDDIVYLKKGASSDPDFDGVVVYQPGSSLMNTNGQSIRTVECSDLTFDYSVAPPNSIMHINDNEAVAPEVPKAQIEVSPNPTSSMITLSGLSSNASVTVMNVLGETVEEQKASTTTTLDLSKLARGTYYIRIASNGSVTTKKIVKE